MCVPVWNSGQQQKEAARIRVTKAFEDWGGSLLLIGFFGGFGCLLWSFLVFVRYMCAMYIPLQAVTVNLLVTQGQRVAA